MIKAASDIILNPDEGSSDATVFINQEQKTPNPPIVPHVSLNGEGVGNGEAPFIALVSHEIRTPLGGLLGLLSLLEHKADIDEIRHIVRLAQASGEQLRLLLSDIIDLARIEAGQFHLSTEPLSMRSLLEEVADFWRLVAEDRGLSLNTKIDPALEAEVLGDKVRVRQILDNLLSNAVKFSREGDISVCARLADNQILLDVEDNGPGISAEQQSLLFTEFGQLRQAGGDSAGAGLGLAVCHRLIALMGGEIGLAPSTKGACFRVRLPWQLAGVTPSPVLRSKIPPSPFVPRLRVLVVEDVGLSQMVLSAVLTRMGCDVLIAENGQEALNILKEEAPDVVLMDMSMPVMDGIAATRVIRAMEGPVAHLPIIGVTGYDGVEDLEAMRRAGVDGFTPKPVNAAALHEALAVVHRRRHAESEKT